MIAPFSYSSQFPTKIMDKLTRTLEPYPCLEDLTLKRRCIPNLEADKTPTQKSIHIGQRKEV